MLRNKTFAKWHDVRIHFYVRDKRQQWFPTRVFGLILAKEFVAAVGNWFYNNVQDISCEAAPSLQFFEESHQRDDSGFTCKPRRTKIDKNSLVCGSFRASHDHTFAITFRSTCFFLHSKRTRSDIYKDSEYLQDETFSSDSPAPTQNSQRVLRKIQQQYKLAFEESFIHWTRCTRYISETLSIFSLFFLVPQFNISLWIFVKWYDIPLNF